MKTIQVSAAIIKQGKSVFATQRGYGPYKDGWEFPGGKIEPGETPEEALVREIREELAVEVGVRELVGVVEYDYPEFHLKMYCFLCEIEAGNLILREHEAAKWVTKEELEGIPWLPGDLEIIPAIKKRIEE